MHRVCRSKGQMHFRGTLQIAYSPAQQLQTRACFALHCTRSFSFSFFVRGVQRAAARVSRFDADRTVTTVWKFRPIILRAWLSGGGCSRSEEAAENFLPALLLPLAPRSSMNIFPRVFAGGSRERERVNSFPARPPRLAPHVYFGEKYFRENRTARE